MISNARKVTLTYRSAKNTKRTATIRLRRGWGQKTLAVGSHKIRAQARATSRLRASKVVLLQAKPPPVTVTPPATVTPPTLPPVTETRPTVPPVTVIPTPGDTTPPAPVTALKVPARTTTSITLSWVNPTDADLAAVVVKRGGVEVYSGLSTMFTDTGLAVWTAYTYQVMTRDAAGNTSPGVTITVATSAQGVVGPIIRVSTDKDGTQANDHSLIAAFSPDGARVAFDSLASNLVPGDTNASWDVFVKTLATGEIQRVSTTADGAQAEGPGDLGDSWTPVWSPDGTRIAFFSDATNLVPGDTNAVGDVVVKTLATGAVERISTDANGSQGDEESDAAAWSPDGTMIAFHSLAANLVPGDTNEAWDVFAKTLSTGAIERVSVAADGSQWDWGGWFEGINPQWSPDGNRIAFDRPTGIYLKTLATGEVQVLDSAGPTLSGAIWSPDGGRLAVTQSAYTGIDPQVFTVDSTSPSLMAIEPVSASADGVWAGGLEGFDSDCYVWGSPFGYDSSLGPAWAPEGARIAFQTCSFDLLPLGADSNDAADVYVKQLTGNGHGAIIRASTAADGSEADDASIWPAWSPDGTRIAFGSWASNLVPGDTNNKFDIFVKTLP